MAATVILRAPGRTLYRRVPWSRASSPRTSAEQMSGYWLRLPRFVSVAYKGDDGKQMFCRPPCPLPQMWLGGHHVVLFSRLYMFPVPVERVLSRWTCSTESSNPAFDNDSNLATSTSALVEMFIQPASSTYEILARRQMMAKPRGSGSPFFFPVSPASVSYLAKMYVASLEERLVITARLTGTDMRLRMCQYYNMHGIANETTRKENDLLSFFFRPPPPRSRGPGERERESERGANDGERRRTRSVVCWGRTLVCLSQYSRPNRYKLTGDSAG